MADPGFPRGGGANSPGVGVGTPTYDFAKFSQKLHEIERIWTPPLRSATALDRYVLCLSRNVSPNYLAHLGGDILIVLLIPGRSATSSAHYLGMFIN